MKYTAVRSEKSGAIRLLDHRGDPGILLALSHHQIDDIEPIFRRSAKDGPFREYWRAALVVLHEEAGLPTEIIHPDEETP